MEGCGSGTGARSGAGPVLMTNGSGRGSRRPKNIWILSYGSGSTTLATKVQMEQESYPGADMSGHTAEPAFCWL